MLRTILLLALLVPTVGLAQGVEVNCDACRDVRTYPMDYGNHAFNVVFVLGNDASTIYSAEMIVRSAGGQVAYVHLTRVLDYSGLSITLFPILSYQVPYPSPYVLISVQDPWGKLTSYQVLVNSPLLIVGDSESGSTSDPEPASTTNTTTGGLDLLGGYDASANYYGGATYPYYDIRLMNE